MKLPIFQKGFNYSQDGPGNRLVYHLQGCNLKCPWCSNPEGMEPHPAEGHFREVPVEEVEREVLSCAMMFFDGGGITLTGGEPTLSFEAVRELFSRLHYRGISCAMETNGTHPHLEELFPFIDFLMIDCKHYDSEKHRLATGLGNETILHNLQKAAHLRDQVLIRIPLIGGVNNMPEDIDGFLRFFQSINTPAVSVEILPYHEYGKDKWKKCGREYQMKDAFISPEFLKEMKRRLSEGGIRLVNT